MQKPKLIKKPFFIPILMGIVVSLTVISVGAATYSRTDSFSQLARLNKSTNNSNVKIDAYVNDVPIYDKTVHNVLNGDSINIQANNSLHPNSPTVKSKSKNDVINDLIVKQVVDQTAERNGISVTNQEALTAIKQTDNNLQNLIKNGTAQERTDAQETWNAYLSYVKGYGLTLTQYETTIAAPNEKNLLLEQKLFKNYREDHNGLSTAQLKSSWESYIFDLQKDAKIVKLDS